MDSNLSLNQLSLNSSLSGINPKPELNKNLYNILVPFYANLLNQTNNQLIQTSQKNLMADKMSHAIEINQATAYDQEKFQKPSTFSPINWEQLSKAQNLRRILSRIHYNKGISESTLHQNNLSSIVPNVSTFLPYVNSKNMIVYSRLFSLF